ncbi:f-box domain-containing protein [Fusarium heterosporum]|uniref:F-box domain-containing protein n=1 Tax=Fusarium heterosporum TaxID=42747 RepID=A0A8H5TK34_FUSHE|nr:f-box domain-containing protein [Fusarium heterosporum]
MTKQRDLFNGLPVELLDMIIPHVPRQQLAKLRSSCRRLSEVVSPFLFRAIKITFAERHIQRLEGVSSSTMIAHSVQELIFLTAQTRDTRTIPGGHIHMDATNYIA